MLATIGMPAGSTFFAAVHAFESALATLDIASSAHTLTNTIRFIALA
jgi:hypothetical protein